MTSTTWHHSNLQNMHHQNTPTITQQGRTITHPIQQGPAIAHPLQTGPTTVYPIQEVPIAPPPTYQQAIIHNEPNQHQQQPCCCDTRIICNKNIPIGVRLLGILHPKVVTFPPARKHVMIFFAAFTWFFVGFILYILEINDLINHHDPTGDYYYDQMMERSNEHGFSGIQWLVMMIFGLIVMTMLNINVRVTLYLTTSAFLQHYNGTTGTANDTIATHQQGP